MLTIHQRPFPPEDRSKPGHWEVDIIIGKTRARRSARSSNGRPGWSDCYTFLNETATPCKTH